MARINLLPWRAERRERRKREFFTRLAIAGVAAVVLVLLWGGWVNLRIDNQNQRNAYLKAQIKQLDAKITEIKNLQRVKDHLLARKQIVEKLQSSRSQMVHLFDQVVKTIPSGARLTAMKQKGDKLTLDGVAQSNATVAEYMRNIEASPWMGPARLVKTVNVHSTSNTPYEFELVVSLGTPKNNGKGAPPKVAHKPGAPEVAKVSETSPSTLPVADPAPAIASAPAAGGSAARLAVAAKAPRVGSAKPPRAAATNTASIAATRAGAASVETRGAKP